MSHPTDGGCDRDQANEMLHQAELVGTTVDEHIERPRRQFAERMEKAQQALLEGKAATLAHSLGISEQDIVRVGGVTDGRDATLREAKRELDSDGAI